MVHDHDQSDRARRASGGAEGVAASFSARAPSLCQAVILWYYLRYTRPVKTAVSIPDPVFKAADKLARRLRVSRSSLYAEAVLRYVQLHDERAITAKLNEVLASEASSLDPVLQSIQSRSIPPESWK